MKRIALVVGSWLVLLGGAENAVLDVRPMH